jgi:hypothetical protein
MVSFSTVWQSDYRSTEPLSYLMVAALKTRNSLKSGVCELDSLKNKQLSCSPKLTSGKKRGQALDPC